MVVCGLTMPVWTLPYAISCRGHTHTRSTTLSDLSGNAYGSRAEGVARLELGVDLHVPPVHRHRLPAVGLGVQRGAGCIRVPHALTTCARRRQPILTLAPAAADKGGLLGVADVGADPPLVQLHSVR